MIFSGRAAYTARIGHESQAGSKPEHHRFIYNVYVDRSVVVHVYSIGERVPRSHPFRIVEVPSMNSAAMTQFRGLTSLVRELRRTLHPRGLGFRTGRSPRIGSFRTP